MKNLYELKIRNWRTEELEYFFSDNSKEVKEINRQAGRVDTTITISSSLNIFKMIAELSGYVDELDYEIEQV